MAQLTNMKFDITRGMHEHIIEKTNLAAKLEALGMKVDESFPFNLLRISCILNICHFKFTTALLRINGNVNKWPVYLFKRRQDISNKDIIQSTLKIMEPKRKEKAKRGHQAWNT